MNNENLEPVRSKKEARERGKNGGTASGKSRQRNIAIRTLIKSSLPIKICEIEDPNIRKIFLAASGSKDGDITIGEAIINCIIVASIRGNSQMMRLLLDILNETPDVRQ